MQTAQEAARVTTLVSQQALLQAVVAVAVHGTHNMLAAAAALVAAMHTPLLLLLVKVKGFQHKVLTVAAAVAMAALVAVVLVLLVLTAQQLRAPVEAVASHLP
jgi:sulfopyruvate decarboxylase TPP-binding subunit